MVSAMAHFNLELREELRDDLMKTVGNALRNDLPKAMQIAILEIMDNQVFAAVDHAIERFLETESMDCWLTFGAEGPHILLGIGPGDCAASFEPMLCIEYNFYDNISRDQEQEVLDQIAGMKAYIKKLQEAVLGLEARAKVFTGRVVEMPMAGSTN